MHAAKQRPGDGNAKFTAPDTSGNSASAITETAMARPPKPSARNVPISWVRAATAEYMVLSDPNNAPSAMIPPII